MKTIAFLLKFSLIMILLISCKKEETEEPTVGKIETSALTQVSVHLKVIVPSGSQEAGFCLDQNSTNPDLDSDRCVSATNHQGVVETGVADLDPGKKYFIRAYAKINGDVIFSPTAEIITRSNGVTLAAESVTLDKAIIKGRLDLIADMPVDYWFAYGKNNFDNKTEVINVSGEESLNIQASLENLSPGAEYQFKLMFKIDGQEFSGNSLKFHTLGAKPEISQICINIPDTTKISLSACINTNLLEAEINLIYYPTTSGPGSGGTINYGTIIGEAITIYIDFPIRTLRSYTFIFSAKNLVATVTADSSVYSAAFTKDGVTYSAVPIGDFWFMTENYRGTKFNNGEDIPYVHDSIAWNQLSTAGMAYYDHSDSLAKEFGALYNWYALADERGMAPAGWRLPTIYEMQDFCDDLGNPLGIQIGGWLKETGYKYWFPSNIEPSNIYGFNARGCGYRDADGGSSFEGLGEFCPLWSSTDHGIGTSIWIIGRYTATLYTSGIANYHNGNGIRFVKER